MSSDKIHAKILASDTLIYHVTEDILVAMERQGVSKSKLARALNKSPSFVTQVLSGSRNMTLKTLSDICVELNIKPTVRVLPPEHNSIAYNDSQQWQVSQSQRPRAIVGNVSTLFQSAENENTYAPSKLRLISDSN